LEAAYVARFASPSIRYARLQAANQTISQVPRYGLEVIAFGGILLLVLYLLAVRQKLEDALPLIALYAFAGYRMLPIAQEIFAATAKMRFHRPALDLLHRDIADKRTVVDEPHAVDPLPFSTSIELRGVAYRYPAGQRPILHDINLEIHKGARVGFIGPTGAGKSTVVDVVLGLLQPTAGAVLIDGAPLDSEDTIRRWQRQIGYVPQHIFLCDDTVLANIAFGQSGDTVDRKAAERAARLAQLNEFIINELPQGYDTQVGERGIRLSGGQRQRLGLARALYGDPAVLVFDEATSALDTDTEDAVMRALDGLDASCTVIMIAHRLSTVRRCDVLFKLDTGRIVGSGGYEAVVGRDAVATV
jgi:ABC-type multidrug transport system fused ATPase/permease subunit